MNQQTACSQQVDMRAWLDKKHMLSTRMLYTGIASGVSGFVSFLLSICGGPRIWEPEVSLLYITRMGAYGATATMIILNTLYIIKLSRLFNGLNIEQM
ncbi:MAG: hypothetical protein PVI21_05060 [Candidatus Woesebacteria bacterium]|jgi:hypothetical protein